MVNLVIGITLLCFAVAGLILCGLSVIHIRESTVSRWFVVSIGATVMWAASQGLFYLLEGQAAITAFLLRYGFIGIACAAIFAVIYALVKNAAFDLRLLWVFLMIPLLTTAFATTNPLHGFFYQSIALAPGGAFRSVIYTYGIWYYIHSAYSYLMIGFSIILILQRLIRAPGQYQQPLILLLCALCFTVTTALVQMLDLFPAPAGFTVMAAILLHMFIYHGLYRTRSLNMMSLSRDAIFENMSNPVLVLAADDTVTDYNRAAAQIAADVGIGTLLGCSQAKFLETWMMKKNGRFSAQDSSIFSVIENDADMHYQIQRSVIVGNRGSFVGHSVEIKNITPIMTLVHQLQDIAYYDNLTGLYNRNYFHMALRQIDLPKSLPLCVVVGDANELKRINDDYGHVKGDLFLQSIADALRGAAPPNSFIARTGGDEFVALIPRCDKATAERYIREVESAMQTKQQQLGLGATTLAMGYKIKERPDESLTLLMQQADQEMYRHKHGRRATDRPT